MSDPCLSVVIPVRNGGRTLDVLLEQLLSQEPLEGWQTEIIVGYQDSTDNTLDVATRFGVKVVPNDQLGPAANRNAAVRASRGDLLYFIDADARPARSDLLKCLVAAASRLNEFGACGGPILLDPSQTGNLVALADHAACWFRWHLHRKSGESFFQPSVNLLVPRAVFLGIGGFDDSLWVLEDFDLQQRMKQRGLRIYFDTSLCVLHRARASLRASCRHSWQWGWTARTGFYQKLPRRRLPFQDRPSLFWLNGPLIFWQRIRPVVWQTWLAYR
jgi:glycosyltransferase involved in cell wall biosynthesis